MKCPTCGGAELQHEERNIPYEYKGYKTVIEGINGSFCASCGEAVLNDHAAAKYMEKITAFNRSVNAKETDPAFIASTRRRLDMSQQEAAAAFGGGANAFSRYETGRIAPPRALVALFELFNAYPETVEKFKALQHDKHHHA